MMTQEQSAGTAVGKIPGEIRKQRPAPNGQALPVGRAKGTPNRLTVALKDAVERAARDCHPQGLAGWLVDRANGSIGDRQIFAAVVSKVIPLQIQQHVQGGISINLNWLGGRQIGTVTAQTVEQSPQGRWQRRRQQSHRRPQEHAKGRVARVAWARARSWRLRLPSSPARPAWPWAQA